MGERGRETTTAGQHRPFSSGYSLSHAGELADALRRLIKAKIPLDGASDHGVSEALYLRDPDGNGLELYWDRPEREWPRTPDGGVSMSTRPLDLEALLREV